MRLWPEFRVVLSLRERIEDPAAKQKKLMLLRVLRREPFLWLGR